MDIYGPPKLGKSLVHDVGKAKQKTLTIPGSWYCWKEEMTYILTIEKDFELFNLGNSYKYRPN